MYFCVYNDILSSSTVVITLYFFFTLICFFVCFWIYQSLRNGNFSTKLKKVKWEKRGAKKVRLFFRRSVNCDFFTGFLGLLTYIRNNNLFLLLLFVVGLRFGDGLLISIYIWLLLISIFITALSSVRSFVASRYGNKSLRLLGYNFIW